MIDYEEKYNKLLEHVENLYNRLAGSEKEYLQQVTREEIPELAEIEDEQHRKWILEYLYDGMRKSDEQFKSQFKCAIAWLENKKTKEVSWPNLSNCKHDCKICTGKCFYRKEPYQKQKSAEWSEEDEKMLNDFIDSLRYNHGKGYDKQVDWLKSIKDRFFPQSKQEWNEENDKFRKYIISVIEALPTTDGLFDSVLTKDKFLSWLKAPKSYDVVENQKSITIPKFKVNDVITSSNNTALKYRIKEVGVKNKIGEYEYVVEDVSDNPEYKGRIHKISIEKVDNWGVLIERPVFYEYDE